MVSSAIWKKTCTSEFFKDDRNCTSPKDECNLKSLKNSIIYFDNIHEKMIKNRMFRRHLRTKLHHLSIVFLAY